MDVAKAEKEVNSTHEKHDSVPYIVYEGTLARNERTIKRLVISLVVAVCLLFLSNVAWLGFISMYDIQNYQYSQDGEGVNVLGDGNGVEYNGTTTKDTSTPQEKPEEG